MYVCVYGWLALLPCSSIYVYLSKYMLLFSFFSRNYSFHPLYTDLVPSFFLLSIYLFQPHFFFYPACLYSFPVYSSDYLYTCRPIIHPATCSFLPLVWFLFFFFSFLSFSFFLSLSLVAVILPWFKLHRGERRGSGILLSLEDPANQVDYVREVERHSGLEEEVAALSIINTGRATAKIDEGE